MDSLRLRLEKQYPRLATVINSGKSGMWLQWGVENLAERVLFHRPNMVFIEFAMNDAYLTYETAITQCKERLELMIDRILETNQLCDIILMTMNPPIREHLMQRPHIEEYYEVYRTVAKERNLHLIDHYPVWKAILHDEKERFDRLVPDGIHPSPEGDEYLPLFIIR